MGGDERIEEVERRREAGAQGAQGHGVLCGERQNGQWQGGVREGEGHPGLSDEARPLCVFRCGGAICTACRRPAQLVAVSVILVLQSCLCATASTIFGHAYSR